MRRSSSSANATNATTSAGGQTRRKRPPLFSPTLPMLRRVRTEGTLLLTLAVIVLVTAFIAAAVPRLLNQMADRGLTHAVSNANVFQRNIQLLRTDRFEPGTGADYYVPIDAYGSEFQSNFEPSIQRIIGHRNWMINSLRFTVVETTDTDTFPFLRHITVLYQNELDPQLTFIEGRTPQTTDERAVPQDESIPTVDGAVTVLEVALSVEAAGQLQVNVGDLIILSPNEDEPLATSIPQSAQTAVGIRIVGLFTINDPAAEYWLGDAQLHRALEYDDGNTVQYYATALLAPEGYGSLLDSTPYPFRYTWRYYVDPEALDAGALPTLAADVRRLDAEYGSVSSSRVREDAIRTGLSSVFRAYMSQRRLAEAVLALAATGLAGVALSVIALVAQFIADRRRPATLLMRGRGASTRQIAVAQIIEGLLVSLPSAVLGYLLALLLVSGRAAQWSMVAALLVALCTTLLLLFAHLPHARSALIVAVRGDGAGRRVGIQRIVLEGLLVVLAIAGAVLLRRRGLSSDSATTDQVGFDPYLAAVPLLVGLAVGVLALRLYPLPVKLLAWVTALRRDLVPVLGFRRVSRQAGAANLPLLVLLLAVAVGVFSSIMLTSIARGQSDSAWQRIGADYRIEVGIQAILPSSFHVDDIDGVSASAMVMLRPAVQFSGRTAGTGAALLVAPDTTALAAVNRGNDADPHFPAEMLAAAGGSDLGQPTNPLPAIVSTNLPNQNLQIGDTFALTLTGRETTFEVVDMRERFPGIGINERWIVVAHDHLVAANPDRPFRYNLAFVRGSASLLDVLDPAIEAQSGAARVTSRWEEYADVRDSPLISGVTNGFRVGLAIAAAYSALAIIIALTITAAARARDTALLRTMGLSNDQTVWLTVAEQLPIVAVALLSGVGLGIIVVRLIEPGVDLTAFTGPGIPVSIQYDWVAISLLCIGLIVVVAGAIAVTSYAARRAQLGRALRLGDE